MPHRQPKAAWKKAQARSRASATRETSSSTADAKAADRERYDLIERRIKERVAACEKSGQRCNVASFFDGLKYFEIAQMKIRDVRLVYAPAEAPACSAVRPTTGAGAPHGDWSFLRAYVGKDEKPAVYSKDNVLWSANIPVLRRIKHLESCASGGPRNVS